MKSVQPFRNDDLKVEIGHINPTKLQVFDEHRDNQNKTNLLLNSIRFETFRLLTTKPPKKTEVMII